MKVTISTKLDKSSAAKSTVLNITEDNDEALKALGRQQLVVKVQALMRRNENIPDTMDVKVSDFAPGTRHSTSVDPLTAAKALSPEERAKLIEQLKAMG